MNATPMDRLDAALSGRYRIERELGKGGMATVYVAATLRTGGTFSVERREEIAPWVPFVRQSDGPSYDVSRLDGRLLVFRGLAIVARWTARPRMRGCVRESA